MIDSSLKEQIQRTPKAELHYHIDSITPKQVIRYADRNHILLPYRNEHELQKSLHFSSLPEFLKAMTLMMSVIVTEEDFEDMILECAADMKRQNIVYRELMFDYAGTYEKRGIALKTLMDGFQKGWEKARSIYPDQTITFIANMDRTAPAEHNLNLLKQINAYRHTLPIIGIGLDMAEVGYPASNQKQGYAYAGENGYMLTGHNGEEAGPESVWDALTECGLQRIDHGVRSVEDPALLAYEKEHQILLTLCPCSNIQLGVYHDWEDYPLRDFLEADVPICINSDDPGIMELDLIGNYCQLADTFHLTEAEILRLIETPFHAIQAQM